MTFDQILVFAILLAVLVLFASGKLRHDIVALCALGLVAVAGLIPSDQLFSGFGHPAVITVMAVLILSEGLKRSGVVDMMAAQIMPYTKNLFMHILLLTGAVTVASAFMNNVGALALMLPVALATAAQHDRSPAIILMPLAFGAILGGMSTLIGTPPNIIIANYRTEVTGTSFSMFDFSPVGLPVALIGVIFVATIGWRLIPRERRASNSQEAIFNVGEYMTDLRISAGSPLIGRPLQETRRMIRNENGQIFGLIRDEKRLAAVGYRILREGDVLILQVTPEILKTMVDKQGCEVIREAHKDDLDLSKLDMSGAVLFEALVSPTSRLIDRNARVMDRAFGREISVLAIARHGAKPSGRLRDQTFETGDVVLLQGDPDAMAEISTRYELWPWPSVA